MTARARLKITGRVQGVFYRQTTRRMASELSLAGWVKNLDDGSVEAFVVGEREVVERFINWCWEGPPSARVEAVAVAWREQPLESDELVSPGGDFSVR